MKEVVSSIHNCNVMDLPKVQNRAGNITIYQNGKPQPFDVKRIYYLYDVPGGSDRGGHAHKKICQLIIAASGSFDVVLDDGRNKKIVNLNRPYYGLLVIPITWSQIVNFSSGAICMVLASEKFDNEDYLRNYKEFLKWKSLK